LSLEKRRRDSSSGLFLLPDVTSSDPREKRGRGSQDRSTVLRSSSPRGREKEGVHGRGPVDEGSKLSSSPPHARKGINCFTVALQSGGGEERFVSHPPILSGNSSQREELKKSPTTWARKRQNRSAPLIYHPSKRSRKGEGLGGPFFR